MNREMHTPGPWEIRELAHEATPWRKRRVYRVEIIAPQHLFGKRTHSRDICQIVDYCDWTDHPANARLIRSAPDLLDVCERLRYALSAYGGGSLEIFHYASRVIKEAGGDI